MKCGAIEGRDSKMMRFRLGTAVLLCGLASAFAAQAAPGRAVPTVKVTSRSPFAVVGNGFAPGEQVRLIVTGISAINRSLRPGAGGSFTAQFPSIRPSRCAAISVVVKAAGVAVAHGFSKPAPECAERVDG
jgi:hypothetical protein